MTRRGSRIVFKPFDHCRSFSDCFCKIKFLMDISRTPFLPFEIQSVSNCNGRKRLNFRYVSTDSGLFLLPFRNLGISDGEMGNIYKLCCQSVMNRWEFGNFSREWIVEGHYNYLCWQRIPEIELSIMLHRVYNFKVLLIRFVSGLSLRSGQDCEGYCKSLEGHFLDRFRF